MSGASAASFHGSGSKLRVQTRTTVSGKRAPDLDLVRGSGDADLDLGLAEGRGVEAERGGGEEKEQGRKSTTLPARRRLRLTPTASSRRSLRLDATAPGSHRFAPAQLAHAEEAQDRPRDGVAARRRGGRARP